MSDIPVDDQYASAADGVAWDQIMHQIMEGPANIVIYVDKSQSDCLIREWSPCDYDPAFRGIVHE